MDMHSSYESVEKKSHLFSISSRLLEVHLMALHR